MIWKGSAMSRDVDVTPDFDAHLLIIVKVIIPLQLLVIEW